MYVGCLVINSFSQAASFQIDGIFCQSPYSLSLVFRLGVDFVLPLSQEEPPTKIYQKEVYYGLEIWHLDLTQKLKTR